MRIKNSCWFVLLGLTGALSRFGFADEPRPNSGVPGVPTVTHTTVISDDEQAIRKTAEAFEVAYRSKNAQAIAAQFTTNGEIVDTEGNTVRGREAIADAFRRIFEDRPQGRMLLTISSVRLVAPGVAVEEGTTRLIRAPQEPPVYGRYAAVDVKADGQWLVASTRDLTPTSELIPASERLKALEFLIGDWVDEAEESVIATSYRWGESRTSILHDFTVKRAGKPLLKGSQRIGWDPLRHTIMSWTFDSAGGHSQGVWTWDHDHWLIKLTGVGGAGSTMSATALLTPLGKDSYRWESTNRVIGGEVSPDATITVVRRPPEPHESDGGINSPLGPARPRGPAQHEPRQKETRP